MIDIKSRYGAVEVSGHADYAPKGQDIICASVSILLYTLAAALGDDVEDLKLDTGDSRVTWKCTKRTNQVASVINEGFRLLSQSYPHYVSYEFRKQGVTRQ